MNRIWNLESAGSANLRETSMATEARKSFVVMAATSPTTTPCSFTLAPTVRSATSRNWAVTRYVGPETPPVDGSRFRLSPQPDGERRRPPESGPADGRAPRSSSGPQSSG